MKPQNLKYSILAVGIISALGTSGAAIAAGSSAATTPAAKSVNDTFELKNQASATYQIGGVTQPEVKSNEVVVTVSRQINFTLTDDKTGKVTPDGKVEFVHTLTNDGNTTDEYTIDAGNATGDDFDYKDFVITVKKPGESTFNPVPGNKVTLEPGQTAEIKVVATAENNSKDKKGKITVSATSNLIPGSTTGKTKTNTDTATTVTPIFAIKKAATTSQAKAGGTVSYTITVKNEGNMAATQAKIVDALPTELQFASTPNVVVKRGTTDITSTVNPSTASNTLTIGSIDIDINETITITFDTQVKSTVSAGTTITNKVTVTDDPDNDPTTDNTITDSSDNGESEDDTNDPNGDTNDNPTPSVVTVIDNAVTITPDNEVTLPPTASNVFTHTITNKSGAPQKNLKLKLDVTKDSTNITQTIYLDTNNNGSFDPGTDQPYAAGTKLPELANNSSVKIFVKNEATDAVPGDDLSTPWKENTKELRETYKITLEGTGAASGAEPSVTDKVNIAGLELKKEQALADCNTTPSAYSVNAVTGAKPGQCIFYRITATNHLPNTNPANLQNITDLVLSDKIQNLGTTVGTVKYRNDAAGTNPSYTQPTVTDNAGTLAGGATKQLTFSVEINK